MYKRSEILSHMVGLMYPFILLFGFYIILNGHKTPGGGFQGGAVLSAVFISRYLVMPVHDIKLHYFQIIEKMFFVLLITIPSFFICMGLSTAFPIFNVYYLTIMNFLIGIKVCCGLSIVFFRFVFYESR